MRKIRNQQLPLVEATTDHPKAKEFAQISNILDANSNIYTLVQQDLGISEKNIGANGMTAEQIFRAAIIKKIGNYSYRELEFHLADSRTYNRFCKIGFGRFFKKSALHKGGKAISAETWEQVNKLLIDHAKDLGIEKGRKVRIDCTVVESNIHTPYDSELLVDSIRVLARFLAEVKTGLPDIVFRFMDHCRRSRRRNLEIMNAKNNEQRKKPYKDLVEITEKTIGYADNALKCLAVCTTVTLDEQSCKDYLIKELKHYLPLVRQVVCQTRRRVFDDESVPALDKIVSIFEPHTDIIRKDRRETYYGHKICVAGGPSNLIHDCVVLDGNPSDSVLTTMMLDRQKNIYGRYPLKAAFDGGFSSQTNLAEAKQRGIKDVCFSKGRGLTEKDMCRSKYVFKGLRNFRAGIEATISWLKRSLGLDRCTWKGEVSFKSYVWASIVSGNLLTLARKQLA
ncbi:MAG: ISNCY family transposase [Gammaproteobacteria bacterium]|nr:ISNCY family transposase [Gammaproteobacteria bacterium]